MDEDENLYLQVTQSFIIKKRINKNKRLIINNKKINFVKKNISMLYPVKRQLKYQEI